VRRRCRVACLQFAAPEAATLPWVALTLDVCALQPSAAVGDPSAIARAVALATHCNSLHNIFPTSYEALAVRILRGLRRLFDLVRLAERKES